MSKSVEEYSGEEIRERMISQYQWEVDKDGVRREFDELLTAYREGLEGLEGEARKGTSSNLTLMVARIISSAQRGWHTSTLDQESLDRYFKDANPENAKLVVKGVELVKAYEGRVVDVMGHIAFAGQLASGEGSVSGALIDLTQKGHYRYDTERFGPSYPLY